MNDIVVPASQLMDDVVKLIKEEQENPVPFFPFVQQEGENIGQPYPFFVRKGEVTLLAGASGSGKSVLMSQLALHLSQNGVKVGIVPFNTGFDLTFARMITQCQKKNGDQPLSELENKDAFENVLFLKDFNKQTLGAVEDFVKSVKKASSPDQKVVVFVDSLVHLTNNGTEGEYHKVILELMWMAHKMDVHFCLLSNMDYRACKQDGLTSSSLSLYQAASPDYIKHSDISCAVCSNVITIAKNSKKNYTRDARLDVDDSEPDLLLFLSKQRCGAWNGYIRLWFNEETLCFSTNNSIPPAA